MNYNGAPLRPCKDPIGSEIALTMVTLERQSSTHPQKRNNQRQTTWAASLLPFQINAKYSRQKGRLGRDQKLQNDQPIDACVVV